MDLLNKAKEFGFKALEKGKDLTQITKLNIEISSLEAKIGDAKKVIGDKIYTKKIQVDDADILAELQKIDSYVASIEEKKLLKEELEKKDAEQKSAEV